MQYVLFWGEKNRKSQRMGCRKGDSLLIALLSRSLCQLGWRKLHEKVSGSADQGLVGEILRDLREQVVHHGHVTLAVQHLLLPIQHNLNTDMMYRPGMG